MYSSQTNQASLHLSLGSSNYPHTTIYCMGVVSVSYYWTDLKLLQYNTWCNCETTIRESLMPIIANALQNYLCASLVGNKLGELYNVKLQLCGTATYRKQIKCCSSYR